MESKACSKCKLEKFFEAFNKSKYSKSGLLSQCKKCRLEYLKTPKAKATRAKYRNSEKMKAWHAEYDKIYRIKWKMANRKKFRSYIKQHKMRRKLRIPKWADLKVIREFYQNCPEGYEVDHIIPLNGEKISGLHVLSNLQYLTVAENRSKSHTFNAA